MTVGDKTITTLMWIKQLSTTTSHTIAEKVNTFMSGSLVRRHTLIAIAIWMLLNLTTVFLFQTQIDNTREAFYNRGVNLILRVAGKSGAPILSSDLLELNVAIREMMEMPETQFAAITDHQGKILAHSASARIGGEVAKLDGESPLETIRGVQIVSGRLREGMPIILFRSDVTYAGVRIGGVSIGWKGRNLATQLHALRWNMFLLMGISAVIIAVILFFVERTIRIRKRKQVQAMQGMTRIGPYVLTRKIAQGGMAELYQADYLREDGFRKTVAVKKVLPHLADNRDFIDMFIREARLAALLQHPNVVQIADFGKIQNSYFIAMEYVVGKNLAEIMGALKKGLAVDMAVFLILKISTGLHYSHTRRDDRTGKPLNIIHRDISPQNILISLNGEVKLSDFGISKASSEPSLTQAGVIKGKLSYLSPEQAMGQEATHQVDIYALGLVFYEILSGERLYRFSNDIEAIRTIPNLTIPPIIDRRPDIPQGLNDIVMRCLEKSTAKRYQTASALHEDLLELKNQMGFTFDDSDMAFFMQANFGSPDTGSIVQDPHPSPKE
ncbi:putative Non-specific protein-tyrosine kinase [Desulfosarcina cetonica]|uniref:serine/threonine protein kinase n=1 Tax=Desulfosarcina cetonica TaxID=90730 RepID=UPI0006D22F2A|nr:serine/threonine-protein kinase [Desulfosarcina cetonica]VTR64635.1 putative Non-specific protein-tyrosine kinase [Desulfosarcina cetonica]